MGEFREFLQGRTPAYLLPSLVRTGLQSAANEHLFKASQAGADIKDLHFQYGFIPEFETWNPENERLHTHIQDRFKVKGMADDLRELLAREIRIKGNQKLAKARAEGVKLHELRIADDLLPTWRTATGWDRVTTTPPTTKDKGKGRAVNKLQRTVNYEPPSPQVYDDAGKVPQSSEQGLQDNDLVDGYTEDDYEVISKAFNDVIPTQESARISAFTSDKTLKKYFGLESDLDSDVSHAGDDVGKFFSVWDFIERPVNESDRSENIFHDAVLVGASGGVS